MLVSPPRPTVTCRPLRRYLLWHLLAHPQNRKTKKRQTKGWKKQCKRPFALLGSLQWSFEDVDVTDGGIMTGSWGHRRETTQPHSHEYTLKHYWTHKSSYYKTWLKLPGWMGGCVFFHFFLTSHTRDFFSGRHLIFSCQHVSLHATVGSVLQPVVRLI